MKKQFMKNVLPAMLAFAFSGIYAIVDGWFVGRYLGDIGLAAINVAYPITAVILAAGTGIGMGGAVLIGIYIGRGDEEKQKKYLGNTVLLLGIAWAVLTVAIFFSYPAILRAFGAEGQLFIYASEYMKYIIFGAIFQIFSTGLLPVIRNYNGAIAAMISMIAGFITNVVLDWLFVMVLRYGMPGAALATVLGQMVTAVPCALFLLAKNKLIHFAVFRLEKSIVMEILAGAVSPFGLTLSPNVVIVILNKGAFVYGGDVAVACYAVVSYVVYVVQLLFQGVGDGVQPLISKFYGLGNKEAIRELRRLAYIFSYMLAVICMGVIYVFRGSIPIFFGASGEVVQAVVEALPIFCAGLLFAVFLRITTSYFYAKQKNKLAYILIYGEPLFLAVLVGLVLPGILGGVTGVWAAVPCTQLCLTLLGVYLVKREHGEKDILEIRDME